MKIILLIICTIIILWALEHVVHNIKYNMTLKKLNKVEEKLCKAVDNHESKEVIERLQNEYSELNATIIFLDKNL